MRKPKTLRNIITGQWWTDVQESDRFVSFASLWVDCVLTHYTTRIKVIEAPTEGGSHCPSVSVKRQYRSNITQNQSTIPAALHMCGKKQTFVNKIMMRQLVWVYRWGLPVSSLRSPVECWHKWEILVPPPGTRNSSGPCMDLCLS